MIALVKEKRIKLLENYPFEVLEKINEGNFKNLKDYRHSIISIFDHFLTEEEAERNLMSYPCINKKNIELLEKFYEIEKKYLEFFLELYSNNEVFYFDLYKREIFFKFENINEFKEACIKNIREKRLFNLIIPKQNIVLLGSFDLNTIICYKEDIDWIKKTLKEKTLFLLN